MVSFMALYNISTSSQYTEVLIEFMLCHTTSNVPPNCSNWAFFIRLLPSLFLACDGRRWGDPNAFGVCFEHCENGYTPRNPYIHNCNLIHKESLISADNFLFKHEEKENTVHCNYFKLNTYPTTGRNSVIIGHLRLIDCVMFMSYRVYFNHIAMIIVKKTMAHDT